MAKVVFPNILTNNTLADAAEVMANLNALKDVANALDDENVAPEGINEIRTGTVRIIIMDINNGHNHDGVNSRPIQDATSSTNGGMRVKNVDLTAPASGWTSDLNAGAMSNIFMAQMLWGGLAFGAAEYIGSAPPGSGLIAGDGWSDRRDGASSIGTSYFAIEFNAASADRVWLFVVTNLTDDWRVQLLGN